MDLLATLHLDALPEQQTRTARPSVTQALDGNPDIKLGFDACCNCGAESDVSVQCKGCGRVSYCSSKCRKEDSSPPEEEIAETQQLGHGSIVCALLRLCDKDDDVDEGRREDAVDDDAKDRVRSEYESYPATLANILLDGPCYQNVIGAKQRDGGTLTIHIVGASSGVELWGDRSNIVGGPSDVHDAYAEALTDLAEMNKVKKIHLVFVGPDCPKKNIKDVRTLSTDNTGSKPPRLVLETHRSNYDTKYLKNGPNGGGNDSAPPAADIVVFFNPGFTCPDYQWDDALSCIEDGTPFLVTTNTEMEGVADCQYLLEKNFISALPRTIADIVLGDEDNSKGGEDGKEEEDEDDDAMFFGENPFAGSRVRQSGNMANDLFVKNRWMFGGMFVTGRSLRQKRKAKATDRATAKTKKKKKKSKGNTKKSNPALI